MYFWKRTQDVASSKSCVHVDGLFAKRSRKQPTEHMSIIFPNALAIVARACSSGEIKEVSATAARRKKQLGGEINSVNKLMPTCLALERSANICQPEKRNARAEHILHTRRCLHSLSRSSSHLSINECTWWVEAISIPSDALARAELSRHFGARIFHHCAANLMLLCSARLSRQVKSISACPPGLNVTRTHSLAALRKPTKTKCCRRIDADNKDVAKLMRFLDGGRARALLSRHQGIVQSGTPV